MLNDLDPVSDLFPWFPERGQGLVHPDDFETLTALQPYGRVFDVSRLENEMIQLTYGSLTFRVKPDFLKWVSRPKFGIGEEVVRRKDGVRVQISEILWHSKERRAFFFVSANGKRDRRRFWDSELAPL